MNTLRTTGRILAVVFVLAALSAPAAVAAPVEERFPGLADQGTNVDLGPVPAPPAASPSEGFDWGDAGIGAAAVVAIMAITGGLALEYGRRQRPRPTVA